MLQSELDRGTFTHYSEAFDAPEWSYFFMSNPKKHHYVPQSLLRRFSIGMERRQVHVFDKATGRSYIDAITNAGAENHFYSVEVGDQRLVLEKLFDDVDEKAASILDSLASSRSLAALSGHDYAFLSLIAAAQLLRVKTRRQELIDTSRQLIATLERFGAAPEDLIDQVMSEAQARYASIENIINLPNFARHFLSKDPVLLSSQETPLIVSDNPVVIQNFLPFGDFGLSSPGVQIFLPISHQLVLGFFCPSIHGHLEILESAGPQTPSVLEALRYGYAVEMPTKLASFLNSLQVSQSSRYLYSGEADFSLALTMLEENPDLSRPETQTIRTDWEGYTFRERMPMGTFVVAVGRDSQHMLPAEILEEEPGAERDCEFLFTTPSTNSLRRAIDDGPFREVTVFVDRFMRHQIRDVVFIVHDNGRVCVRMRDEGLHRLFRAIDQEHREELG